MTEIKMKSPNIAGYQSVKMELEPGVYYYCTCGKSSNQPFCDGSHNTDSCFEPLEFTITERKKYALCACKHTAKPPFCDGYHKKLCKPEDT
jgi:CDGSH iron-sulfur domain-containing protein 3